MSKISFYWGSGSPYSWRVMLALELKQLDYESHLLQFSQREHKSSEFLKLNPRGKVPVLKDGDYVVYESMAVLSYLDAKYPEVPIFGTTPEEAGDIRRLCAEFDQYMDSAFQSKIVRPLYFNKTGDESVRQALLETIPQLHAELASVEQSLQGKAWLVGGRISAAELVLLPLLKGLERAANKPAAAEFDLGLLPLSEKYPNIAALIGRVEQLPGYERTYPPHWRE